jgi:CcmD family protein
MIMQELIPWVWIAFSVAWTLHAGYVVLLSMRQKRLLRQIEDLQQLLKEQQGR